MTIKNVIGVMLSSMLMITNVYAAGGVALLTQAEETQVNTAGTWNKLIDQYNLINDQYTTLKEQYEQVQQLYTKAGDIQDDLNGKGTYKDLLNDAEDITNQTEWTAQDWDDALRGMAGANQARFDDLKEEYQSVYNSVGNTEVSDSVYEKGASHDNALIHEQDEKVNQTSYTSSAYEYEHLDDIAQQISQISADIDSAETTKKTLDLQAKLSEQIAYIQLEELKMQTIQNQQVAETEARSLNGETQASVYLASLGGN